MKFGSKIGEKAIHVGVMASGKSSVAEVLTRSLEKCVHLRGNKLNYYEHE